MNVFPVSSFIYIFSGTICLVYARHYWQTFRQTNNEYSKMFFQLGVWVAIGMYLYGIPSLFYVAPNVFKGVFWILGSWSIFFGINNPIQVALISWGKISVAKFVKFFIPIATGLLAVLTRFNTTAPYVDNYGIIHWSVSNPYNFLWFISGILITIIPAAFLFQAKTDNRKAVVKKTLFSVVFLLGGLGGWSNIITNNTVLLAISFIIMFLGFLALAAMAVIDIFMKENLQQ